MRSVPIPRTGGKPTGPLHAAAILVALGTLTGPRAQAQTQTASTASTSTLTATLPAQPTPTPVAVVPVQVQTSQAEAAAAQQGPKEPTTEAAFETPKDDLASVLKGKDMTGTPPGPPREDVLPAPSAAAGEPRPAVNYDGREAQAASAGEILIWVPRIVLYPVHLVMNYLVRVPIVWTVTRLEEYYVFKRIERFLSFRDGKSIIFPTFFGDFGLRPGAGLTNNNTDLFFKGNDLSLSVGFGGPDFISASVTNNTKVLSDNSGRLRLFGNFVRRSDQPFYGEGPFTSTDQRYNYEVRRLEAGWELRAVLEDLSWISFGQTLRSVEFANDGIGDSIAILDTPEHRAPANCGDEAYSSRPRVGTSRPYAPCGYSDDGGYGLLESRLEAKIDTRDPDTEYRGGSGMLFEAFGSFEFDPTNLSRSFVRFGGEVGGFWDVSGAGHTLALRIYGEFTERTGSVDDPIPFTELPALGGMETMRGFLQRRFVGDSAFMATASYRYPIWSLLDAEIFASVGNVFDGHYSGWSFERQALSSGISLRTSFTRDSSLQILFAVGTNRFEESENDNFKVDSVRFAFGYVKGF